MTYLHERFFDRKKFDQPVLFEINTMEEALKNVRQTGIAIDISDGGLGLKTDFPIAEQSVLKFHIPVKEMEITLPVFAQVMWTKSDKSQFRSGLRFLI